jgi:type IV pilus assembly protein PilB
MAKARGDFSELLVRDQLVSPDQLVEARSMADVAGAKIQDILIKLGYVTPEQAMKAYAEFNKLDFVDLTGKTIHPDVIKLVPESVARDNLIIPLEVDGNMLKVAMSDPTNYDLITKLQFILNRKVIAAVAGKDQIQELINKNYGDDDTNAVLEQRRRQALDALAHEVGDDDPGTDDADLGLPSPVERRALLDRFVGAFA